MMLLKRAIVFALDAIIHPVIGEDGSYEWSFDPRLPGLLRDCRATGHCVFGLLNPSLYGLSLDGPEDDADLALYINGMLYKKGGVPLDGVHISAHLDDPKPLWAWKRQFGFSLASTSIVGEGEVYERLRRNAGLSGLHWSPRSPGEIFRQSVHMLGL
jgi:hypothetical protein